MEGVEGVVGLLMVGEGNVRFIEEDVGEPGFCGWRRVLG